nr:reverse transcriptase domain-containing protein [Tanacetum cinerariifolium]
LRLPPVTSSYYMRAGIQISGLEMVIGFRTGDRVNRRSGVVMTRVSMCIGVVRTRVLSIGVVKIDVMIRNNRIFGVRIRGLLVGMGMTTRVKKQSMSTDLARLPPTTGRFYATTRGQAAKTSSTITGILSIDDRTVFALFDTGAKHSIISTTFAKKL